MPGYSGSSGSEEEKEKFSNMTITNSISNKLNIIILLLVINLALCFTKIYKK